MENEAEKEAGAEFQPLYAQVKALITKRIGAGEWKPGTMLPNEFQLAAAFNVSQGTVRKALMALEAERLIVRRQGRGTYVARHTSERTLFHFFRMVGMDDRPAEPISRALSQKTVTATREFAARLEVPRGTPLHCITRYRIMNGAPAIFERIYVPVRCMPDLAVEPGSEMLDEMYVIYQERFGTTIAHASERLASVAATDEVARQLGLAGGSPVLQIFRVARDVNRVAVELRISFCRTDLFRYAVELN